MLWPAFGLVIVTDVSLPHAATAARPRAARMSASATTRRRRRIGSPFSAAARAAGWRQRVRATRGGRLETTGRGVSSIRLRRRPMSHPLSEGRSILAPDAPRADGEHYGAMNTNPAYVVETEGLTKRFGERVAVDGVDLRI